jgi:hypothetical protein
MAFSIFREILLSLLVGCDYRDYRNDNPWSFDEKRLQNSSLNKRVVSLLSLFSRGDRGA